MKPAQKAHSAEVPTTLKPSGMLLDRWLTEFVKDPLITQVP